MIFKKLLMLSLIVGVSPVVRAQAPAAKVPAPNFPKAVAGIPVNYDEDKVGTYTLHDPLMMSDGAVVKDAKTWWAKRRPEIASLFETQQYGKAPGRPAGETFDVFDKGTPVFGGKAIRKQVMIYLNKEKTGPSIQLLVYLPAKATKPVPMFFSISFTAVQNAVDDPGVKTETVWEEKTNTRVEAVAAPNRRMNVEAFLDAGIGVATYYYGDIDPDYLDGFKNGIRATLLKPGQKPAEDDWGSISAWAWGMSRVQDYFETDKQIDAKRVAIHGVSRLGKTVMWAGAHDQRFAAVIASCSGEGGAALSARNYGETIAHLTAPSRYPYQFAINYGKWGGFPDKAPMDGNMLIALVAPRPLLLQTGSTDGWSDPNGEFLAAVSAGPVYKLLGKTDMGTDVWPAAGKLVSGDVSYYMHEGGHGMVPGDWDVYVAFLKKVLKP